MEYGYVRVSTASQDLDVQLDALERAGVHPSNIFQEKISGVAKLLPVRDQVLAQLAAGDRLNVHRVDRLGRSVADLSAIVQRLDADQITFRAVSQSVDTSGGYMGRAFLHLLMVFAEMERRMLLDRTSEGLARRAALGLPHGRPRMYGTVGMGPTAVSAEQAERESRVIRWAVEYVLQDAPMNQVVDVLNWRGIASRDGGRWAVNALRRVLTNPQAETIVGEDAYRRLVAMFDNRSNQRQKLGRPVAHLLSGILVDGREGCGAPMYGTWKRARNGGKEFYYACKSGSGGRFAGCGRAGVSMARADAYAEDLFVASIVSDDFAQSLSRRQAELLAGDATAQDLDDWREEINDLETVPARFAPPDAAERLAQLQTMVREATARLMLQPEIQALADLPRSEAALRASWGRWSTSERRSWVKRLVHRSEGMPATAAGRASDVESRMSPVFRL
jgi:DNA invertase Pin-like site-specific DNA recombinase